MPASNVQPDQSESESGILLSVTSGLSKPYYQKGHHHYLVYSLNGSITSYCSGFYVPPIRHIASLEFYIRAGNTDYKLSDYIERCDVYSAFTRHFFYINKLNLRVEMQVFVVQELPAVVISIKPNKKMYKLIAKPKFVIEHMVHKLRSASLDIKHNSDHITVKSRFDKHLRTDVYFSKRFRSNSKGDIIISLGEINIKIVGTSDVEDISSMINKKVLASKSLVESKQKKYDKYLFEKSHFVCSDNNIQKAFLSAKFNIHLLRHCQPMLGQGFFAGIPQYPEFFGRDTFWALPGIIMTSDFENAKYSLNVFTRHQSRFNTETKSVGKIPHEIWLHGEPNYYSADSTLLYIYAVYYYYLWSADKEFIKHIFESVESAFGWVKRHTRNGYIINKPEGFLKGTTWMDSYNRSESAVEMQALLARCSFFVYKLAKAVKKNDLAKEALQLNRSAKRKLKNFWTGRYYADRKKKTGTLDNVFTCNQFVPLMFKYTSRPRADKIFTAASEKGLLTSMGVRTRAKNSSGYDPGSYHKGMIWPLTTAWTLFAALKYNKLSIAKELFQSYYQMAVRYVPGFMPECVHGNKFSLKLSGEKFEKSRVHFTDFLQLWSAAMFVQAVVEGLFGIKPMPRKKAVRIKPVPLYEKFELRDIRIFDSIIDIKVDKDQIDVKVKEGKVNIIADDSLLVKRDGLQDARSSGSEN